MHISSPWPVRRSRKGFSLIEVSIVMACIGLVVAGLWIGNKNARTQLQYDKLLMQIVETAENIRRLSPPQSMSDSELYNFMDVTGNAALIPKSQWPNYMPAEMIGSGTHPQTPWGTNIQVAFNKHVIQFYPTLPNLETCVALGPRLQTALAGQLQQDIYTNTEFNPVGDANQSPGYCQSEQDSAGEITLQVYLRH